RRLAVNELQTATGTRESFACPARETPTRDEHMKRQIIGRIALLGLIGIGMGALQGKVHASGCGAGTYGFGTGSNQGTAGLGCVGVTGQEGAGGTVTAGGAGYGTNAGLQ